MFTDIQITDMDTKESQRRTAARRRPEEHRTCLILSAAPPAEWSQILIGEHHKAMSNTWHEVQVSGRYLIVNCSAGELQDALNDLTPKVARTNEIYRQSIGQQEQRQSQKAAAEKESMNILEAVRKKLFPK